MTQSLRTIMPLVVGLAALECRGAPARATYHPVHREITITTLPLLTKEMAKIYPFLTREFAHGGLLDGKEIYAFEPSTVTVVEGDTIDFQFINPEDDLHSFVLAPDLSVTLPGLKATSARFVARRAGIYPFTCSIPAHLPSMWGQLVVLSPEAVATGAEQGRGAR
ncbi:MAG TPA: cupredoxin domain-containing protein [Gemmatimonadales bacterium]|nr:cupredoxin domain-containing protein [Gemmatimonadales bacterium]